MCAFVHARVSKVSLSPPPPSLYVCLCAHRVINYKVILFHTHAAKYNPYHDDKMMDYLQGYTVSHACAQLD